MKISSIARNLYRRRLTTINGLAEVYRPTINQNVNKLLDSMKEKAETLSKSKLGQKMRVAKGFYTLEMAPPSSSGELSQLKQELVQARKFITSRSFMSMTVKQAWLLILVITEVGLWFYLGETFGKMHIVGYKV